MTNVVESVVFSIQLTFAEYEANKKNKVHIKIILQKLPTDRDFSQKRIQV